MLPIHHKIFCSVVFLVICCLVLSSSVSLPKFISRTKNIKPAKTNAEKRLRTNPLKSTIRNLAFWGKASHIYATYKVTQVRILRKQIWNRVARRDAAIANTTALMWAAQHEKNSERMIKLCLGLRGFYLKTGQFLGTRYDFMPSQYTKKLSTLHDSVPPLPADIIKKEIERELKGPVESYFTELDLDKPLGSASIAQVHRGIWRSTGEKCAVKVQYPNAESLMRGDLRNLRVLAEFLQRTELKFDVLSTIKELQKNIHNEFDFVNEAKNMAFMQAALKKPVPEVNLPRALFASKRVLVMTFVEGNNLGKLAEFRANKLDVLIPTFVKQRIGRKILDVLSKAWGEMIFNLQFFNSDPHPGNICLSPHSIGLLDWGQVKRIGDDMTYNFAQFIEAMNSRDQNRTCEAFLKLGVKVGNPAAKSSVEGIAVTMLDTRVMPGYDMDPFSPKNVRSTVCSAVSLLLLIVGVCRR